MQQFYCEQVEVKLFSTIFKYKHHLKCNLEFVVLYLDSYSQSFSRRVRSQALNLARFHNLLEPVCCKKWPKIVPDQLIVWRVGDLWRTWLIQNCIQKSLKLFPWSSRISLVPFRTFRGPLFPKPVTGQELFLAVSYSKPALEYRTEEISARN